MQGNPLDFEPRPARGGYGRGRSNIWGRGTRTDRGGGHHHNSAPHHQHGSSNYFSHFAPQQGRGQRGLDYPHGYIYRGGLPRGGRQRQAYEQAPSDIEIVSSIDRKLNVRLAKQKANRDLRKRIEQSEEFRKQSNITAVPGNKSSFDSYLPDCSPPASPQFPGHRDDNYFHRLDEQLENIHKEIVSLGFRVIRCEEILQISCGPFRPASMPGFGVRTPSIDEFIKEVGSIIRVKDGKRLQDVLRLEPPLPPAYQTLQQELLATYPRDHDSALVAQCEASVPRADDGVGSTWGAFPDCLVKYLRFLRDFNQNDGLGTFANIKALTNQCIIALSDTANGITILYTVLEFSRILANAAMLLDKNPQLTNQALSAQRNRGDTDGATEKVTFVEDSANVLRDAFIKCLAGGGGIGLGARGQPENKRTGIYMTANRCLRLLFQCRKLRNAQQMFVSIDAQSPLLSFYPAAQRVTYLYFLGRYHFANSHFYRAQLALQAAYDQCHHQALKHRRLILIYLIASNICLGRFPSSKLLLRREANVLSKHFLQLCRIIAQGDLGKLYEFLDLEQSVHARWFLSKRILLQLQNRCEVLTWRSLIRKTFFLQGFKGGDESRTMPYLSLKFVQAAARWSLRRRKGAGQTHNPSFSANKSSLAGGTSQGDYVDPEFLGMEEAMSETGFDPETGTYHDELIGQHQPTATTTTGGSSAVDGDDAERPTMPEVESIMASLIQQGFLGGFLTHSTPRWGIPGGNRVVGGPMAAGFSNVWSVIQARSDPVVPGWVKDEPSTSSLQTPPPRAGLGLAGRVVNLSNARPVGAGA